MPAPSGRSAPRVLLGTLAAALAAADPAAAQPAIAIEHVRVLPMDAPRALDDQTVVVREGRIVALGPAAHTPVPAGATRIDGRGRTLMPGLAEMHAHVPPGSPPPGLVDRVLALFVINGVTTARGMLGDPRHLPLRDSLADGRRFGPRLVTSGPSLNGTSTPTVAAGVRLVREEAAAGYDFLKIHPGIPREVFDSITATARTLGIPWAGHVPLDVGLGRALALGHRTIDHVDGVVEALVRPAAAARVAGSQFFGLNLVDDVDPARLDSVVGAIKASGTWIVPTQTLFESVVGEEAPESIARRPEMRYWPADQVQAWVRAKGAFLAGAAASVEQRRRYLALRQAILRALRAAEVPVLLGSDAPQVWNVPGFSIHRELRAMVEAGWTPYEALRAGTADVARFLGWRDAGQVAVGMRADLLLLDADPLADIGNAQRIAGVVLGGRWHDRADLDRRLTALLVPAPAGGEGSATGH